MSIKDLPQGLIDSVKELLLYQEGHLGEKDMSHWPKDKPKTTPKQTLAWHMNSQKKSMEAFEKFAKKHPKVNNVKSKAHSHGRVGVVYQTSYDTDKSTQNLLMKELDKLEKKFKEYNGQTNVSEETGDKAEYQKFFQSALKKFGVKSPAELKGDKEKEFYDYIDKNWKGDKESD